MWDVPRVREPNTLVVCSEVDKDKAAAAAKVISGTAYRMTD